MGKIIERCAGIDIGKRFLLCCVLTGAAHEEPHNETRRFDTTVAALERLRTWLIGEHLTEVVRTHGVLLDPGFQSLGRPRKSRFGQSGGGEKPAGS
jgi:hypothetical protein